MKCRLCDSRGATFETDSLKDLVGHYKSAHPGERSPDNKSRTRPSPQGGAAAGGPAAGLAPPPGPPDPSALGDELGDELDTPEIRPTIPAELEIAPAPARRKSWREWLGLRPKGERGAVVSNERKPARHRHESTAELLTAIWGGLGYVFIRGHVDEAVGRCLQYQAPVAGHVLEGLTKGSAFDRVVLQPLARNMDNAEAAAALFALPSLVYAYPRVPAEARPMVEMLMQEAALATLKQTVPVLKAKRARERELEQVLADLKAEGVLDPDTESVSDAVDAILNGIFSGPAFVPEPEPSANGASVDERRHEVPL